jgi:hypothetical protein
MLMTESVDRRIKSNMGETCIIPVVGGGTDARDGIELASHCSARDVLL